MIKQNKTRLTFILAGLFFAGVAATGCNNGDSEKTATTDSVKTEVKTVKTPVVDSLDSILKGNTKPTPEGH